ncbi:probable palmitoyltransferase ZDHHC12 isoform X4 [Zalophus californianus]|uniref:Probable palmitoyltransferase ZDHHC12 isoform X4 n=1 Tax=Zalophus californianus TaxID=9704 RepID=A0A6J2ESM0_ZALCA|nr:probable palmitoyltransferase ZDHHC12 isoform X4 [Zalophus californianus]
MAPWALLSPGVLVRTGHTVLTWGITLVLFLHDTAPASLSFSGLSSAAAVGRAGGAAPAPYLPAPRAGLPAALPGRVAHGPGLCECPAPAPGGGQGGADSHGSSSHPPSALQILPGAAAPAGPALPRVSALRAPLRPPLPLDGELRGGAQPPALRGLPGAAAGGASVGPVPGMVWPPFLPALGAMAAVQWAALCHLPAALPLLFGGQPAPRLTPLPGGQQHHHLGVHLLAPHCLPPPAPQQPL